MPITNPNLTQPTFSILFLRLHQSDADLLARLFQIFIGSVILRYGLADFLRYLPYLFHLWVVSLCARFVFLLRFSLVVR